MQPLTIGPRNAESATGLSWRWIRDHASEMGVELVRVDGKTVVRASDFLDALQRRSRPVVEDDHAPDVDELAQMRARVARAQ